MESLINLECDTIELKELKEGLELLKSTYLRNGNTKAEDFVNVMLKTLPVCPPRKSEIEKEKKEAKNNHRQKRYMNVN